MASRRIYDNPEDIKNEIKYLSGLIEQHKKKNSTGRSTHHHWNSKKSTNNKQLVSHGHRKWTNTGTITKQKTEDKILVKQKYKIVKASTLKPQSSTAASSYAQQPNQIKAAALNSSNSNKLPTIVKSSYIYKKNNVPLKERAILSYKSKPQVVLQNKSTSKSRFRYCKFSPSDNQKVLPSPRRLKYRNTTTSNKKQLHTRRVLHRSQMKFIASSKRKSSELQRLYCLRYISFGKCNRGTYCTFIHDKSRVSICPRLLRGKCTDPKCLLSHVVTKDKLPVCSFYMNGNCNVAECQYLHVNVGKTAIVCDDFALRGSCKSADKCEKQHVRCCPEFHEKQTCSQRNCRLFHFVGKSDTSQNQKNTRETKQIKTGVVTNLEKEVKNEIVKMHSESKIAENLSLVKDSNVAIPLSRSMPVLPDFISISSESPKNSGFSGIRIKPRLNLPPSSP